MTKRGNIQHSTFNIQRPSAARPGSVGCSMFLLLLFLCNSSSLKAQPNSETNALPTLSPPYAELPPTFWEQHGIAVLISSLAAILPVGFLVWLCLRPKPKIILPPEVEARNALELLRGQSEDGVLLSNVSQILRHYFIAAFRLPPGEPTTAEFCRAI